MAQVEYLEGLTVEELKSAFEAFLTDGEVKIPAIRERVWETFLNRVKRDCSVVTVDDGAIDILRNNAAVILRNRGAVKSTPAGKP